MSRPIPEDVAAAIRCALEAERAFGMTALPAGRRFGPIAADPERASDRPAARRRTKTLADIADRIAACRDCALSETRTKTVPGQGSETARLMFVGEAPGRDEDLQGLAFVGRAGALLTKMIAAMGLDRDEVFIANVLKCRPPNNRDPRPEEANACFHYLLEQIELIQPEVICALGAHAANNLLDRAEPISRLRGRVFPFRGAKLVPTFHPSYLLRSPDRKRDAWADLQVVMDLLGLPRPGR